MLPRYYGFGVGVGGCHPWRWWPESGRHHAAAMGEVGKKKRRGSCEMGLSRLFFCMGEHGVARNSFSNAPACRQQPYFATNNHPLRATTGWLRVYFCLGLSSVMLLCWEYGHQTFSMHGYVGDGFRRG
ncbi:unnamed protein product [Prunus brigantina]